MISQASIDTVLERVSLIEVIGETVSLRRAGTNYVGLCPFHGEKSPSFNVREEQGYFHCFGCGASGNAIHFLMKAKGLSFPDAVEELAQKVGITLERQGVGPKGRSRNDSHEIYNINLLAGNVFRQQLKTAPPAVKKYLIERGLKTQTLEAFGVGFAPDSWNFLAESFKRQAVPEELLSKSGLVRRNAQGEWYDVFRARVIFPIWLDNRKICGFGGRLVPGFGSTNSIDNSPKYLNSSETAVYQKSKLLFGLPQALESIRTNGLLYLVEGYMDVLGLWQAGVKNVVATCGTALTEQHVRRLSRMVKRLRILFDGDVAGRTAAGKCFPLFLNSGIEVSVLFIPDGEDPDTIALKHAESTNHYLESLPAQALIDCYIDYLSVSLIGTNTDDLAAAGKGKVAENLCKILLQLKNSVEQSELIEQAARKLKVENHVLFRLLSDSNTRLVNGAERREIGSTAKVEPEQTKKEAAESSIGKEIISADQLPRLDRELLKSIMVSRFLLSQKALSDSDLCQAIHPSSLSFLQAFHLIVSDSKLEQDRQKEEIRALLHQFGASWVQLWREAYKMSADLDIKFDSIYQQCCREIGKSKLLQVVKELDREISAAPNSLRMEELSQQRLSVVRRLKEL